MIKMEERSEEQTKKNNTDNWQDFFSQGIQVGQLGAL
jgi:hypothetical protein